MGAVDYFLKLEGVEGESQDKDYKKQIDVESWSWGETQSGTHVGGGGREAGSRHWYRR
jgi:type VI secretion system secreted protein Hcp